MTSIEMIKINHFVFKFLYIKKLSDELEIINKQKKKSIKVDDEDGREIFCNKTKCY